jgi:hypothetical protein
LVQAAYEGVSVNDYQGVIDFLESSSCMPKLCLELKTLGPATVRENILQDFAELIEQERQTTPAKIQEVLDASPLVTSAFDSEILWDMIDKRYNSQCLVNKFREHPEMLFALEASSSSSDSEDTEPDEDQPDSANTNEAAKQSNENSGQTPTAPAQQEGHNGIGSSAIVSGVGQINQQGSAQQAIGQDIQPSAAPADEEGSSESQEGEDGESGDIVWDLFNYVAKGFLQAYTGKGPLTLHDSCHFQADLS